MAETGRSRELRSGEVARRAGVSADTLRHYEQRGLLRKPRRLANGYRAYPPEALDRVLLIQRALAVGFTLDELAEILRDRDGGRPPCRKGREPPGESSRMSSGSSPIFRSSERSCSGRSATGTTAWRARTSNRPRAFSNRSLRTPRPVHRLCARSPSTIAQNERTDREKNRTRSVDRGRVVGRLRRARTGLSPRERWRAG